MTSSSSALNSSKSSSELCAPSKTRISSSNVRRPVFPSVLTKVFNVFLGGGCCRNHRGHQKVLQLASMMGRSILRIIFYGENLIDAM